MPHHGVCLTHFNFLQCSFLLIDIEFNLIMFSSYNYKDGMQGIWRRRVGGGIWFQILHALLANAGTP